jgi:hypothetical protein
VAELRGSGGTVTPCPEESKAKKQPTIWKHAEAENVAKLCISDMMTSGAQTKANPKNLQWRGNYLCLASETSSTIPTRILQQAFNRRNITDQEALSNGLCLYRLGGSAGEKQYPVLVLEPQNPLMQAQAAKAINFKVSTTGTVVHDINKNELLDIQKGGAPPSVHKIKTNGLLEAVLRCLSLILEKEQPACFQADSVWHRILSQSKTAALNIEEIPKKLWDPLSEMLEPSTCDGIHSILHVFEHVVLHLGISHLFLPSESSSCSLEKVVKLGKSETTIKFEEAIAARLRCGENEIATPRVLAVSKQCTNLTIETEVLALDVGKSRSIQYGLGAFIVCEQSDYTSYVKNQSFYKVNDNTQRKQTKTALTVLNKNQAFLLFVQDIASSPSEAGTCVGAHCDFLSKTQHSKAKEPKLSIQAISSAQLPLRTYMSATAASAPAKKNQINLTAEILKRIEVCNKYHDTEIGPVPIAQCAAINLSYDANLDMHLEHFRRHQMDLKSEDRLECSAAKGELSEKIITCSLAHQTRPEFKRYQEKSAWVFIDELCEKLRTSTGYTHSLQSLELDRENIMHAFNKPSTSTYETKYLQYIENRGMALMEAVKYHNDFYKKKKNAGCLIRALHIPDTTETSYSNLVRGEQTTDFKQTTYAYLLYGMLAAGKHVMQELVIYLPVSANERQNILQILCGLQC